MKCCTSYFKNNAGFKPTKLDDKGRLGKDKQVFLCAFNTDIERNVTWFLNGKKINENPNFEVIDIDYPYTNTLTSGLRAVSRLFI